MVNVHEATAKLLEDEFGIDQMTTALLFERGLLSEVGCRNMLIKEEYKQKAVSKERQRIKNRIGLKYCISVALIEKIIA